MQTEDGPVKKKRGRGGEDAEADGAPPSKGFNLALLRQPLEQRARTARCQRMRARLALRSACHLAGSPSEPASPSALVQQQQQRAAQRQKGRQMLRNLSPARRTPAAALQQHLCQLPWHSARGQLTQPQMGN